MAETKQLLERAERAFDPPTDVMDALVARRDRKRRKQRIEAGLLGLAIAIGLGWQLGVVAFRSTPLPADQGVTTPEPPSPEPPPAGSGALAYGVDGDVFLADADGSNAVKIADGAPEHECAPGETSAAYHVFGRAWSPDGRYLAYWDRGCPDPWGTVYISDTEGNVVASFAGQGWAISWSPDSTRVAVMDVWAPDGQVDATIGVYGVDGSHQALTVPSELFTPQGDYSPVWSRDGSSILIPDVQVPIDGDAPTPLPDDLGGVYSPDGSRVAYLHGWYRGSLVVADAEGSDAQKTADPGEFWWVAWSPSGDLVAYERKEQLLVRDVATGTDTSLLDVPNAEVSIVEFSPDGERILFTRSGSLWSVGVDGSGLRRLVDDVDWADLRPQGDGEAR